MGNIIRQRTENERKVLPNGKPKILFEGKLGAVVAFPMLVDKGQGYEEKMFERFVRPPGTRIIAFKENKIYLQKEYRVETNKFEWRLPGGKVFDSFEEFKPYISKEIPEEIILGAGKRELKEEAKLYAGKIKIFKKSSCGATIGWDLYYLKAEKITAREHEHNEGEEITEDGWFSAEEIVEMCRSGQIDEDRTVAVLYKFITQGKVAK